MKHKDAARNILFIKNPWDLNDQNNSKENDTKEDSPFFSGGYFSNFNFQKTHLFAILLAMLSIWLASGFYIVQPQEEAVKLRFGKYVNSYRAGLRYHLPNPIEYVAKVNVTRVNREEIGFSSLNNYINNREKDISEESLMLTGDENIVDLQFEVQWKIRNARDFIFNVLDRQMGLTVKTAAESAMREAVGQNKINYIIEGIGRANISNSTYKLLQAIVDSYNMGVDIVSIQMKKVDPPAKVIGAFRDVQSARADKERIINNAQAYYNELLPKARGKAEAIIKEAEGSKIKRINMAQGETEKFLNIHRAYLKNPSIVKKKLYFQTVGQTLEELEKIFVSSDIGGLSVSSLSMNDIFKQ